MKNSSKSCKYMSWFRIAKPLNASSEKYKRPKMIKF